MDRFQLRREYDIVDAYKSVYLRVVHMRNVTNFLIITVGLIMCFYFFFQDLKNHMGAHGLILYVLFLTLLVSSWIFQAFYILNAPEAGEEEEEEDSQEPSEPAPSVLIVTTGVQGPMQQECSICYEFLSHKDPLLPCDHRFHMHCISRWFTYREVCPLCLQDYSDTRET